MIVTGKSQNVKPKVGAIGTRPGRASYAPAIYEIGKNIVKSYGFYKDIEPYLPDKYVEKYVYKPHKRVYAYARTTKGFLRKTKNATSNKFHKKCPQRGFWNYKYTNQQKPC